jgi:hypothetical protein
MAQIKCSECNQIVSDQVVTCPRCGSGIARKTVREATKPHSNLIITQAFLDAHLKSIAKAEMMCRFSML